MSAASRAIPLHSLGTFSAPRADRPATALCVEILAAIDPSITTPQDASLESLVGTLWDTVARAAASAPPMAPVAEVARLKAELELSRLECEQIGNEVLAEYEREMSELREHVNRLEAMLAEAQGRTVAGYAWWLFARAGDVISAAAAAPGDLAHKRRPRRDIFSDYERDQIIAVQTAYRRNVLQSDTSPLPPFLTTTSLPSHPDLVRCERPLPPITVTFWLVKIPHSSPFDETARKWLALVCAYQTERLGRRNPLSGAMPDDPTSMVLAELKTWIVAAFARITAPDVLLWQELTAYKNYLTVLLEVNVFPPGAFSTTTMRSVLSTLRDGVCDVLARIDALGDTPAAAAAAPQGPHPHADGRAAQASASASPADEDEDEDED